MLNNPKDKIILLELEIQDLKMENTLLKKENGELKKDNKKMAEIALGWENRAIVIDREKKLVEQELRRIKRPWEMDD